MLKILYKTKAITQIMAVFIIFLSIVLIGLKMDILNNIKNNISLLSCKKVIGQEKQLDCVDQIIEKQILQNNIVSGMRSFVTARNLFKFIASDCHYRAHRLGDIVYYNFYLNTRDISKIEFPEESTMCNGGFIHGFLEHLIQDNPNPATVTETCEFLRNILIDRGNYVSKDCYHGSGHGFLLAQTEKVSKNDWGNLHIFIDKPLFTCEQLEKASDAEKLECMSGVFTTLGLWMGNNEYGFSLDEKDPLLYCKNLKTDWQLPCYSEITHRIKFELDTAQFLDILESINNEVLRNRILFISASRDIRAAMGNDEWGDYEKTLVRCEKLQQELYERCIAGIIKGLFSHGEFDKEYIPALALCNEPVVLQRNIQSLCYEEITYQLHNYYTNEKIRFVCSKFPANTRMQCLET